MGLFIDAGEMYEIYATLFGILGKDPCIDVSLANAGPMAQFRLSGPDGIMTLNMKDKTMRSGMYVDYILGECDY